MRALKLLGWVLLTLIIVVLMAALIFAATFNPNAYKPEITENVRAHLGRELEIPGDLRLSFFPPLTLESGRAVLYEKDRKEHFASVEKLRLRVAIAPLFSKRLQIDAVSIEGVSVEIIRDSQRRLNIDDLIPSGPGSMPAFFIGSVSLKRAQVRYRDQVSGNEYALTDISATLAPVAPAHPGRLSLAGRLRLNDAVLEGPLELETGFVFKAPGAALSLGKTLARWSLTVKGASVESRLKIDSLAAGEGVRASVADVAIAVVGATDESAQMQLTIPAIEWKDGKPLGVPIELSWRAAAGAWKGEGSMAGNVETAADKPLRFLALQGEASGDGGEYSAKAVMGGAAGYDAATRKATLHISAFKLDLGKASRGVADIRGALRASYDLARDKVESQFEGTLNGSHAQARFDVPLVAPQRMHFTVNIAAFDMDRVIDHATLRTSGTGDKPGKTLDLDLAPLRALGITGELSIGRLKRNDVTVKNLRILVE